MANIDTLVGSYPQGLTFQETGSQITDQNFANLAIYLNAAGKWHTRRLAADITYTTNTTLSTILTIPNLLAGAVYFIEGVLFLTTGGTGGLKVACSQGTDATLTATLFSLSVQVPTSATAVSMANSAALGTAAGASSGGAITALPVTFSGFLSVDPASTSGGAIVLQTAQNSSNSTSTVKAGSYWILRQITTL